MCLGVTVLTCHNEPKNWTWVYQSTSCLEGSLVLNPDQFFLSSLSCPKTWKWGYVRTPSCHFPHFKEISVWNLNQFGPIFKRNHKIPMTCKVFYVFFEFSSSNGGSSKAVPVSSCRQPIFAVILVFLFTHTCCLCCHSRNSISYFFFRAHDLEVFGHR